MCRNKGKKGRKIASLTSFKDKTHQKAILISNQSEKKGIQWRATAALSRERERKGDYGEHRERKGERKRKGAVKRGERGSCQMQMTSLGEGEEEGAVWRGALQFIFSIQRAPPPLLYCPSVWQLELAMWRGEQKRACCPAWVRGRIGRHPTFKKQSQPDGPHWPNPRQNTLKLTQQFFLSTPPKPLNTRPCVWCCCKTEINHAFCNFMLFVSLKKKKTEQGTRFVPSSYATEWHFSCHAFCTLALSFIRNYSESKFSFSSARGPRNGPATRRQRGKFLSCSVQFEYKKEWLPCMFLHECKMYKQEKCMVGDFYHDCQWVVLLLERKKEIEAPRS